MARCVHVISEIAYGLKVLAILFDLRGHAIEKWLFSASLRGSGLANRPSQAAGNLLRRLTPKNNHF